MTMSWWKRTPWLLAATAVLCLSACYVPPAEVGSKFVKSVPVTASEGATLTVSLEDSPELAGTTLVIPPGALSSDQTITLELGVNALAEGDDRAAGPVAIFGPAGTRFSKPATLTLPAKLQSDETVNDLFVAIVEGDGRRDLVPFEALTISGNQVAFEIDGFTSFQACTSQVKKCKTASNCASNETCVNGSCKAQATDGGPLLCTSNATCQMNEMCVNGLCQVVTPDGGPNDGGPVDGGPVDGGPTDGGPVDAGPVCTSDYDCGPTGYCLNGTCQGHPPMCQVDSDCGPNSVCVNGACYGTGADGGPADAGPYCLADSDCGPNGYCVNGFCQGPPPQPCNVDADCGLNAYCQNGVCYPTTPPPPPDGGTPGCLIDADCGPNAYCQSGVCYGSGPVDAGVPQCLADADCGPNAQCVNGACYSTPDAGTADGGTSGGGGGTSDGGAAVSCSANDQCPGGMTCTNGVCM